MGLPRKQLTRVPTDENIPTSWFLLYRSVGLMSSRSRESKVLFLDAAIDVFRSKGYSATRIEDVCAAASLTKGSFFHHFSGKEDLALAAAAHWNSKTGEFFANAEYHHLADPLDRLIAYIELRKSLIKGNLTKFTCFAGTLIQETYGTHPEIRDACEQSISQHASRLEPDIGEAMLRYQVNGDWTPRSLALHMQGVTQGAFILAKAKQEPELATECLNHLRHYIELLFSRNRAEAQNIPISQSSEAPQMTATSPLQLALSTDPVVWPETHYVFIERIGPTPVIAAQTWADLHQRVPAMARHNTIRGFLSLYKMKEQVYRAGVSLFAAPSGLPTGLGYEIFRGGKYHRFIYTGPYSRLGEATTRAVQMVRERNLSVGDDYSIEHYVTDPKTTPEDQLVTEILFPAT
jgi:TetR/AcrR family transcriptional regulator, transcriptional repressor for nem operon